MMTIFHIMEKKGGPVLSDQLQAIKGTQSNAIKSVPLIETNGKEKNSFVEY
jgi:hypothetical protein